MIVHKLLPFDERKDQRDLQEISQRLMEAANTIAGSSLEQTTWLRRNVSVKINASQISESDADGKGTQFFFSNVLVLSSTDLFSIIMLTEEI